MALVGRELFQTRDVIEILKISRRQLQYWAQTDLIAPSAQTPGGHGRYTFEDLVALKAAKRLIDAGVSVQRIRKSIRTLRRILPTVRRPLAELILVATGDVVLAFQDGTAFEAVSGQEWIFAKRCAPFAGREPSAGRGNNAVRPEVAAPAQSLDKRTRDHHAGIEARTGAERAT